jgi:lysophospholipase L1-like esterase
MVAVDARQIVDFRGPMTRLSPPFEPTKDSNIYDGDLWLMAHNRMEFTSLTLTPLAPKTAPPQPSESMGAAKPGPASANAKTAVSGTTDLLLLGDGFVQRFPKAALETAFAGRSVVKRGDLGLTTSELTANVSKGTFSDVRPRVVVVEIGFNGGPGADDFQQLVAALRGEFPSAKILLNSIPPRSSPHAMDDRNRKLRALTDDRTAYFLDLDPIFCDLRTGAVRSDRIDSASPTAEGYRLWADALKPVVEKLLNEPTVSGTK